MFKQKNATFDITTKSEKEKEVIKDAILWMLTYNHLEVFRKKEFENSDYVSEYPLAIFFKGDLEELVFTNVENLREEEAEKIVEIVKKHGILGLVAWFAYKVGDNDVIHECYKTDDYNAARAMIGLGAETQMEEDYELFDAETLEIIIISYSDCICDLVKVESDYQGWVNLMSDMEDEEE